MMISYSCARGSLLLAKEPLHLHQQMLLDGKHCVNTEIVYICVNMWIEENPTKLKQLATGELY